MSLVTLDAALVEEIHDEVMNPGELPGRARDKSLDGALARVEDRLAYGMIEDAFDLGPCTRWPSPRATAVHDANKRTAHAAMDTCLVLNGVRIAWDVSEVGPLIVEAAQGRVDEAALARWLRGKAGA